MIRPRAFALHHAPRRRAAGEEGAAEVGLDGAVPFLDRHVEHGAVGDDAGVGDGDRGGTQRPLRRSEEALHHRLVAHVHQARVDALATQLGRRRLDRLLAHVAHRDAGAGGVERPGDAEAKAGGRPGDDDHRTAEVEHVGARRLLCHRIQLHDLAHVSLAERVEAVCRVRCRGRCAVPSRKVVCAELLSFARSRAGRPAPARATLQAARLCITPTNKDLPRWD